MVTIASLWLSLLLATVLVWIASALVWMVLPHHKSDYRRVPDEDGARAALTPDLAPGQYMIPHLTEWDPAKDPEGAKKFAEGVALRCGFDLHDFAFHMDGIASERGSLDINLTVQKCNTGPGDGRRYHKALCHGKHQRPRHQATGEIGMFFQVVQGGEEFFRHAGDTCESRKARASVTSA